MQGPPPPLLLTLRAHGSREFSSWEYSREFGIKPAEICFSPSHGGISPSLFPQIQHLSGKILCKVSWLGRREKIKKGWMQKGLSRFLAVPQVLSHPGLSWVLVVDGRLGLLMENSSGALGAEPRQHRDGGHSLQPLSPPQLGEKLTRNGEGRILLPRKNGNCFT